jgi:TonB-dependent SusC/RagA subfamily outer membrane receptor
LFIVDGVLRPELATGSGADPGLQPADIDHIEILKGPAAVQLYGPAGRDGVVLIRTKAAAGTAPQPLRP